MSKVYRVAGVDSVEYFNTAKETNRCKPGGDEPESVECFDAAAQCNLLDRTIDETERRLNRVRMLLAELIEVCPTAAVFSTRAGKNAFDYLQANPLPPATAGERDGGRSYGNG